MYPISDQDINIELFDGKYEVNKDKPVENKCFKFKDYIFFNFSIISGKVSSVF